MADLESPRLCRVRPTAWAREESKLGSLFTTPKEQAWVFRQLLLLQHWPVDWRKREEFGLDLDFEKIGFESQTFYELRLHDAVLSHNGNLRVFFWIHEDSRTVWIVHGYWKKSQRIAEAVKRRVARRVRELRGQIQDGSIN